MKIIKVLKVLRVLECLAVILSIIAFAFNVLVVDFAMSKFIWIGAITYYISSITYDMLSVCEN